MSRFLKSSSNKRSSSYCEYSSKGLIRAIPCRESPNQSQNINDDDDSFTYSNKHTILTEPSYTEFMPCKPKSAEKDISQAEIERLVALNSELKKENRALTNKLIENSNFQLKICQLESQNKQLQKELNRKDDLLRGRSQEGSPVKQTISSRHDEVLNQNNILNDEIKWLKGQLDGMIHEKSTIEVKSYAHQKLEARLEEANSQIELLKQELVKKNYELEELYDRTQRSKAKSDSARFRQRDDDRSLEILTLREEASNTQIRLEQATKRCKEAEHELVVVQRALAERDLEFDKLRASIGYIDKEKEDELKLKEKEIEKAIKAKTNDAIKQMLQEKLQYEQKLAYLEQSVEDLKAENAQLRANSEEWKEMKLQKDIEVLSQKLRECKEEKANAASLLVEQEKETAKMQREVEELGNEIILYQERMKNLEKMYKLEKEDFSRSQQEKIDLLKRLQVLKEKIDDHEIKAEEERTEYEKSLERLSKERDELYRIKGDLEKENEVLITKSRRYREKLEETELKLNHTMKESEKFKDRFENVNQRVQEKEAAALRREYSLLKETDLDIREVVLQFTAEKKKYESEIQQLRELKQSSEEQVEKLYELLNQRKKECDAYLDENERLWCETERLRNFLHDNSQMLCDSVLMEAGLQKERCNLEIERLNKGLEQANIELSRKIEENEY